MPEERLQKIIAAAGLASRRAAEELIEQGRVQLNGQIVTELGTKADPTRDHIRVDGKLLQGPQPHRYYLLNKPRGYVTTVRDPEGRPTVMQFFERLRPQARLYPVGRLDYLSEGLLLMTNDGELANKLTKASTGIEKTYLVKVSGRPSEASLDQLRGGVMIEKGRIVKGGAGKAGEAPQKRAGESYRSEGRVLSAPARVTVVKEAENPWFEVVLIEGRNRELRKMFEEVGHHVEKIRRVGFGPLILDIPPGEVRELGEDEIAALSRATQPNAPKRNAPARKIVGPGPGEKLPTRAVRPKRPASRTRP